MSFRIGLVGLCTSHPEAWVPIIREQVQQGAYDCEVVAAWDSGETRSAGFAKEFCAKMNIPHVVENLEDMLPLVDGVIVHTTNWDKHIEQAEPFIRAKKSVFLDKPVAGNLRDLNRCLDWLQQGCRLTGGSALRYFKPSEDFLAIPEEKRGKVETAYTAVGVDDYNYGIHGYAVLFSIMGSGCVSAQYVGQSNQKQIILEWGGGRIGLLTVGKTAWLPSSLTVVTDKQISYLPTGELLYCNMLRKVMPYLTRKTDVPPVSQSAWLEPEFAALAARTSWLGGGKKIFLTDLRQDDPGYDGTQFALEYRRARLTGVK